MNWSYVVRAIIILVCTVAGYLLLAGPIILEQWKWNDYPSMMRVMIACSLAGMAWPMMIATMWSKRLLPAWIDVFVPAIGMIAILYFFFDRSSDSFFFELAVPLVYVTSLVTMIIVPEYPRSVPANVCFHCGYDLRGATSHVCSECGRRPPDGHVSSPFRRVWLRRVLIWLPMAAISGVAQLLFVRFLYSLG